MKFIGITGGVGAGKSELLAYLAQKPKTRVLLADEIAHDLMQPKMACYEKIKTAFAKEDIFLPDGNIDRKKMAAVIFSDAAKRLRINGIIHPAVKEFVQKELQKERERGCLDLLVLEAALLIEEHYDEICDELWYIDTREDIRERRLMESRGYSKEKVQQIFLSQLPEAEYKKHCRVVIDNNGTVEEACRQIDRYINL